MKKLLKKYIDLISINDVDNFCNINDIYLNEKEKKYILNLIKTKYEDILINEEKYIKDLSININKNAKDKLIEIFYYYKRKYSDYLF